MAQKQNKLAHPRPLPKPALSLVVGSASKERNQKKREQNQRLQARLAALDATIKSYDKNFDFTEVIQALNWAEDPANAPEAKLKGKAKPRRAMNVDDYFSEPLQIVESLVKLVHADRNTILAAILYPSVRPLDGEGPDTEKLKVIAREFGGKVSTLVDRTLRFRALKMVAPKPGATQSQKDHLAKFRLMGLWAAKDPRAIVIRGAQLAANLDREIEKPGTFAQETTERMMTIAQQLYAPLAYISGHNSLRTKLLNNCYQLEDPEDYNRTCKVIAAKVDESKGDHETIQNILSSYLESQFGWEVGKDFEVEFRAKSAFSARDKARRKKVRVEELGDLYGARIVLKKSVVPWSGRSEDDESSVLSREAMQKQLGDKDLEVYGRLSQEFGRGNKKKTSVRINPVTHQEESFSPIQERLAELAIVEPRDTDEGRLEDIERFEQEKIKYPNIQDARFDDYITWPKLSGYSAVQDSMFITLPNTQVVEIELQVVDEMRREVNTYGPQAGHVFYKNGLKDFSQEVIDWRRMANLLLVGKEYTGVEPTYVFDHKNQVIDITSNPSLSAFAAAANEVTKPVVTATMYRIDNGYDRINLKAEDPRTRLRNGDTVVPVMV